MTRTPLDYTPRHKKPDSWAGSTPRGPHRWARAAANAMTHPRSAGAKLYRARVNNAARYDERYDETPPIEFRQTAMSYREDKYMYSVCSTYCTVMQLQLEYHTLDDSEIFELLFGLRQNQHTYIQQLNLRTLTRDRTCQCCGSKIRKARR